MVSIILNEDFLIKFCHDSCKLEGNSLSISECTVLLKDGLTPNAKKLREIFEPLNTKSAFEFIASKLDSNFDLTFVKDIHEIIMNNISQGGILRNSEVKITGSDWIPPVGENMLINLNNYFFDLSNKKFNNNIEKASFAHCEFVKIHPFKDGNGRTARLILNFFLINSGFAPISISNDMRVQYYDSLEIYDFYNDLSLFVNLISKKLKNIK